MRRITQQEFNEAYDKHQLWLKGEQDGVRADFSYTDFTVNKISFKDRANLGGQSL